MNKKFFVLTGIIIILILGLGEVFFFSDKLGLFNETEFDSTPTQWSQEKDYLIEETSEGTIVTNKTAGFSFKVPENWGAKSDTYDNVYTFDLIAPNSEIKRDEYGNQLGLLKGCGISISTIIQETEVGNTRFAIENAVSKQDTEGELIKETIDVNNYPALKTTTNPSPEAFQKLGKFVFVKIPISDTTLIDIGMRMMPGSEVECIPDFNKFLASFSIQ